MARTIYGVKIVIEYFKTLLATLKSIDSRLAEIAKNTKTVSDCVRKGHHGHGDQCSLSTKHWND